MNDSGSKTGEEPITESVKYEMFLEATDCFSGSLQTVETRRTIVAATAEEMHIDPQRVEHFLTAHIPRYEDSETHLTVGRVRLTKRPANRISKASKKSRPFANTTHAKKLLEQVGVAVKMAEPVLLVGETGIGKTTVVQQLADSLGVNLTAVNLSQQSEVGDLLGGFKPVNVRSLAIPLKDEFDDLFAATGISTTKNQKYIEQLGKCVARSQWSKALKLWREAPKMFDKIISELKRREVNSRSTEEQPTKRRKTESRLQSLVKLRPRWERFSKSLDQFDIQLSSGSKGFAFNFVEGNIVKAARNGDWVLLDEINLASPDTLESIADLLHSGSGTAPSILLSETGEIERVRAHPDFRIFGAMNPATDVGKRDLPMGLRSRFTELYVESPDRNLDDLLSVIKAYLKGTSTNDEKAAHDVARLYLNTKRLTDEKRLVDGANQVPHFSLRTLTRVLGYVSEIAPSYGLRRSLYEGFAMGFLTLLNSESEKMLMPLINHHLLDTHGNAQSLLSQTPRHPDDGKQYVRFMNGKKNRQYWMLQGAEPSQEQPHYIITPFVERNMLNLVRATSTRKFPVLVQGPTSSGKTSMIEYLAKFSGNKFVRINNHEHTDLQEYLGTYVSGADGQLRFQEGLLVQALRQGHWIVLDELNLAPTDVLEALNRLLDDNRELLIPETQEIVRPHENFMLFATQNPPGLYGGRKTLSRAFRNRFLELHFDDIPEDELDFILEKRSQKVAPSDCRRIVAVYKELSRLRQSNRLFEQKDSFATLRDLFRWALRDADNREQLAANGYMLLAERVRNPEERIAVKEIIERVMKVNLDPNVLYDPKLSPEIKLYEATSNAQGIVWTQAMRRLYVLVAHALRNNEPVLLVGETGCGKTTVCQMLADAFGKDLNIVNAHQNTETGDLIGAQRPLRNRAANLEQLKQDLLTALGPVHGPIDRDSDVDKLLSVYRSLPEPSLSQIPSHLKDSISIHLLKTTALFEWSDGALVHALKAGQFFLLDEISLADDSVLERLNSVLEPARTILLAEKGTEDSFISAADGFQFLATMNPGGDYGKRELSPALRNRFTEIWVPSLSEHDDVLQIVQTKLQPQFVKFALPIVHFSEWFGQTYRSSSSASISVRDILAWIQFVNTTPVPDPYFLIVHGAAMVYVDTLGANPAALLAIDAQSIYTERAKCIQKLGELLQFNIAPIYNQPVNLETEAISLSIGGFSIGRTDESSVEPGFALHAPTTKLNGMRVLRALQVQKPILIEGSPGVGKTTLIAALARACNRPLTRINLSEQTDLMDLFGSDVPVEGAEAGHFAWRDAPFLQAMQKGEWVLLDEMNLASQSVLEGLNACLDHRGEVYISELDQTFKRHPEFSVFAAQNPHHQGGGRKGLPASFVNRFTVVYADIFRNDDLELICTHNFPTMDEDLIRKIIRFVSTLEHEVVHSRHFGLQGGPWEFNLRDVLRWLQLLSTSTLSTSSVPAAEFLDLVIRQRFRSGRDREQLARVFSDVFGSAVPFHHLFHNLSSNTYQVGRAFATRNSLTQPVPFPAIDFTKRLAEIESVMICIEQNLPCILVGSSGSGKTTLLEHIAAAKGKSLVTFPLNSDIDTMDLVGGFEQVDPQRGASHFLAQLSEFLTTRVLSSLPAEVPSSAIKLLQTLETTTDTSAAFFTEVGNVLESLKNQTSLAEFETLAQTCRQLAASPMTLESARFEWIDGLLVKAIEQGEWLVLDNANLCSASVLDRLNSLLEPNGVLSINEHCGPDGEPKLVRPHPEFRLFLTMDARFEFFIEIDQAVSMQRTQIEGTSTLKPSKMNRLQRSLVRERVPTVSKDSTINISGFLEFVLAALKAYIQSHCHDAEHWRGQKQVVMETTSRMETLAHRFDALKWKTAISISEVGHIMQSLCKAFKLLFAPAVDGASLLESINFELEKLENNAGETQDVVLPYFAPNFEVLRQLIELQRLKSAPSATSAVDNEIIVLSNYPTVFEMRDAISADSSHLLPGISNILGQSDQFQPVSNSMSYSLLRKLNDIRDVDMKSLRLLEAELPIIGKQLSKSTASLCRDQLPDVNEMLGRLVIEIVAAHSDNAARELNSWVASLAQLDMTASTPSNLRVMLEAQRPIVELGLASHVEKQGLPQLTSALYAIEASKRQSEHALGFSAIAWVQFAIASLLLYVPDRTFDPDKRQRLERERHQSLSDSLQDSVSALRRFEDIFTHQNSNARIQLLESEIADLGEAPAELQPVYRPAISELDQLQGEFNNIIRTFAHASIDTVLVEYFESRDSDTLQQIKLIQNNAKQIIRRLDERFPAYNDLTSPVVNMLHCLVLGLSFAILTENNSSASNQELQSLSQVTPFLGGTPNNVDESFVTSHPVQYLNIAAATASITTVSSLDSLEREHLFRAIHVCYEQWSKRLEHDRREEESAGGLYRFRGSAEDEDEEDAEQFNELFPSYDEDSTTDTNQAKSTLSARDAAIEVARVHASIFLGGSVPFESLLGLIRQTSTKMALIKNADSTANSTGMTKALLQGAFLLLSDYTQALSTSATAPDAYNFYTDAHLPETRKLVNLVHQIQTRFRELQSVDEIGHMQPLEDVLVSCRQLLQFSHTEPLAKIITKVEQIHTYMHEWQFGGWASRANSALSHYDNLTATIVSWRRLELSTWAKLFDMETKKCDDDARSWWFVAYQVTVAAPLQISGSPLELKEYAQKLLQDLEVYFSSAIIGQFTQRLELLKQLQLHLQALALDIPHLSIIHSALSNFIILYSSYEKPVQDHLKKGRLTLEKSMKDVLLMASWKDTNIVALRDSAKRSHHKLFKLVRKFRALLSQPMEFVIKQGIPDQEMKEIDSISLQSAAQPLVSLSALKYCEISVPGWSKKSKRFTQVSKTVGMMVDASQVPDNAIDGSDYLNSFLSDLLSNTVELQKATPSVLTDENKDEVKHLKTQKRKLFADTLKDLRRMGIKHNLGADALAKQSSLSATLAAAGHIASNEFQIPDLEYYFNKAVDLVPRAREAARQPSPDLSGAEVTRSSGFVEGMLEVLLSQHSLLASTSLWLKKLRTQLRQIEGLWAPGSYEIQRLRTASNIEKLLRWLPNIIKVAVHVIDIHAKMGQLDAKQISDDLRAWQDRFEVLTHDWDALAILPDGVISTKRQETESAIRNASEKFRIKLEDMVIARPDLAFALDQIVLWVRVELSTVTLPKPSKTIQDLDQKLSNSCDAVLLAIEKHKKDVLELSGSTEDQGWFIKHDSTLIKSIKSLHSKSVVSQLENCFAALRLLDLSSNEVSQAASAVFASALPIFQQYLNTLEQSVTRHASLHRTTCKAAYILTKSFVQITTQGFCTPSEKSDAQDGQTEKLEGGTGLGDGEGAQDISKDIQDDENLDELAQEPNTEKGEMEDEQDAVDMADGEMEGEMGDAEEKGSDDEGSDDGSQSGDDMDEETGDVDDLDPTAVDEKMWDGDGEQAEKDQEGDESKGKSNEDEQVAAQEKEQKKQAGEAEEGESGDENEEEDGGAEQGEEVKQDEVEKHDPHAPEGETLDLPEDMELDGEDDKESVAESDGGLEDMSDVEQDGKEDEVANDGQEENDAETADAAEEDQAAGSDMDVIDVDEDQNEEGEGDKTEDAGQQEDPDQLPEPDHDEGLLRDQSDEAKTDADNAMPSEAHGVGEDQEDNANDKESSTKAQRDNGGEGGDSSEQKDTAAEDGERGRQANGGAPKDSMEETQDTSDAQPFKKLGEALEQWHRQQTKIRDPAEQKPEDNQSTDVDPNSTEFQHLQDEDAQADTQALGTASEEQARALDESMAVDEETTDMPDQFQPDEVEMKDIDNQDAKDVEDPSSPNPQENSDAYEGRAGAMIKQAEERDTDMNAPDRQMRKELEEDVAEVDNQLESTHLDETTIELRSAIDAREQWTHYEAMTRDLSLSLTEQLRLILAPTLATKMRGDFRTGKRLNIKRIIPYIASQYKRDKIWMRRSVPSKRSYQIMLAVDDSKSMGESGSGSLAFETLVMVSKSLSMLEVGDICVLGFGDQVNIAHDFDTPFSSDAGPRIFQHFGFEQSRTDVTRLVRESIEIFRTARAKASSSPADLWQLQLIISDGVCDSSEHEPIRRLLREALEERIMMVFVIVDDVRNKKKGESVMDLKEARFVKDENTGQSNVKIERYLDTFPFQYYLIVSDVKELPGVLATLLRQWFTEVVDSSG
ncbi:putative Midasin [Glarea lozoyensis 74030]|uniref:Midasin n=1 Tax=Glarea lozoyensis (strain ATCC 74030 / MF5533) TaxID=1104152 RepID=H0EGJ9_GLAL7|nr:putative Midasin [Glarea lozoyensis 74030]